MYITKSHVNKELIRMIYDPFLLVNNLIYLENERNIFLIVAYVDL